VAIGFADGSESDVGFYVEAEQVSEAQVITRSAELEGEEIGPSETGRSVTVIR
jgi:hypothetical protein